MAKIKDKVWYVVYLKPSPPHEIQTKVGTLELVQPGVPLWAWVHTKSWARDQAIELRNQGCKIIDIFPGTKARISHEFRGLHGKR